MKKVLFLSGTRADYGKLKPLIKSVESSELFECHLFITGMHTLSAFGDTKMEVIFDKYRNIHVFNNQIIEEPMDLILANTINGFSRYILELKPDLIIIHGDRVEALAAAISGALNNTLVGHIEGGEISGTIDESIRHAITKLAHIHFVSNEVSKNRLIQLGEKVETIFVIGSPDIDLLIDKSDLTLKDVRARYGIEYDYYAVVIFHPVTTELHSLKDDIKVLVDALIESNLNYIVIAPNNDSGYKLILDEYNRFKNNKKFKLFPSIRFEYFIELLRYSSFIIGNSSVGIHEAPVLGIPTINIGTRQNGRFKHDSIFNSKHDKEQILELTSLLIKARFEPTDHFGDGNSSNHFFNVLLSDEIWKVTKQKEFVDFDLEKS